MRPDGDAFLEATDPSGAKTTSWIGIDGVRHQTSPTGRRSSSPRRPTRAGASTSRSRASSCAARRAGARRRPRASARSTLADVTDPLSLRTLTDTVTTNGRTSVLSYDAAARQETSDLARGADRDDDLRRQGPRGPLRARPGRRADHLRLRRPRPAAAHGRRATGSTAGSTTRATGPRSASTTPAGAPSSPTTTPTGSSPIKRPGGGTERYEYDAEGARTAVVLPDGQRHVLKRDARGALSAYDPLAGAELRARHDGDGRLTSDGVAGDQTTYSVRERPRDGRQPGPTPSSSTATTARSTGRRRSPARRPAAAPPSATRSRSTARRPPASPPPARRRARSPSATTTTAS